MVKVNILQKKRYNSPYGHYTTQWEKYPGVYTQTSAKRKISELKQYRNEDWRYKVVEDDS